MSLMTPKKHITFPLFIYIDRLIDSQKLLQWYLFCDGLSWKFPQGTLENPLLGRNRATNPRCCFQVDFQEHIPDKTVLLVARSLTWQTLRRTFPADDSPTTLHRLHPHWNSQVELTSLSMRKHRELDGILKPVRKAASFRKRKKGKQLSHGAPSLTEKNTWSFKNLLSIQSEPYSPW